MYTKNVRTYIDTDPGGADVSNERSYIYRYASRWC